MLRLDYIQEYITLAETLSFTTAAEKAGVTQSALSRHIAAVEDDVGVKLIDRTTRSVELTASGKAVYQHFKSMMQSYEQAKGEAGLLDEGDGGQITLGVPYYWSEDYAEPLMLVFQVRQPEAEIHFKISQGTDVYHDLYDNECDLVIFIDKFEIDSNLRHVPFARERLAVAMRDDHPLRTRETLKLEELAGETFISFRNKTWEYWYFNKLTLECLNRRGIYPKEMLTTQQLETLGITIYNKGGVCLVPYGLRMLERPYLRIIPLEDDDTQYDLGLYYRGDFDNPLIPKFVQVAQDIGSSLER